MKYLLDTNVLSELARPRPDDGVLARLDEVVDDAAIAAWCGMSCGSVSRGCRPDGAGKHCLPSSPVSLPASRCCRTTRVRRSGTPGSAHGERAGRSAPFADGQIAAVAVTNGLRLVTRNVADFAEFADLAVESWWTAD